MGLSRDFVITKGEALRILGIKGVSLDDLEHVAKIPSLHDREGYTSTELKRLMASLRRILSR
ncbi:MAG: hypothetical protein HY922_10455 [Elusimicrobia bacterium]|nr:hypothetical protein [Elusimicrobiota bacterium]